MPFSFEPTELPGVILVVPRIFEDDRGLFFETYKYSEFAQGGISEVFVQDNQSKSSKNVLRGLHYQKKPSAQGKLVRAVKGRIFDVAVDIRKNSPNYAKWFGVELSDENRKMLYIPAGFAHGFLAMSDEAEITYKVTSEYAFETEGGIIWDDPEINIDWPCAEVLLSEKDIRLPRLCDADNNFEYEITG